MSEQTFHTAEKARRGTKRIQRSVKELIHVLENQGSADICAGWAELIAPLQGIKRRLARFLD